jgi:AcrR family transcriptional regulator
LFRRNPATQRAILAAAARLVRQRGYNAVTIEAIAAEAGAGKQTIYRWWKTKAVLFAELLNVSEAPARPLRGPAAAELRRTVAGLARRYASPLTARIQAGMIAEGRAAGFAKSDETMLKRILARARTQGDIRRNADIGLAAGQLVASVWYRAVVEGRRPDRRFSERLVAQTLRGMLP